MTTIQHEHIPEADRSQSFNAARAGNYAEELEELDALETTGRQYSPIITRLGGRKMVLSGFFGVLMVAFGVYVLGQAATLTDQHISLVQTIVGGLTTSLGIFISGNTLRHRSDDAKGKGDA